MRLTASRPFFPWPTRLISGKPFSRKASSSRAGFSSSTMSVLMDMVGKQQYRRVGFGKEGKEGLPQRGTEEIQNQRKSWRCKIAATKASGEFMAKKNGAGAKPLA